MAIDPTLPNVREPIQPGGAPPTGAWRKFFEKLASQPNLTTDQQAEIAALDARVTALENEGVDLGSILGLGSVTAVGSLGEQVIIQLEGDEENPTASHYYGTDAAAGKGWHELSLDALSDVDLITVPPGVGDALVWDGTSWVPGAVLSNPMTTLGDIITADTGGTPKRLGVGSSGEVLTVVSGEPAWAASGGSAATAAGYAAMRLKAAGFRSTQDYGGTPTAVAAAFDRAYAQPFTVDRTITLTGLSAENSTTSATGGAKFRCGIYSNDNSGAASEPDALLVETGDLTVTVASVKTGAVSITLNPGTIYWSVILSNINVSFRCYPFAEFPVQWFGRSTTTVNQPLNHLLWNVTAGWSSMPATWTGAYSSASSNAPAVFLVE